MSTRTLLTAEEVASILHIRASDVYRLGREGKLARIKVGDRLVRFDPVDVEAFISGNRQGRPVDWNEPQEIPF